MMGLSLHEVGIGEGGAKLGHAVDEAGGSFALDGVRRSPRLRGYESWA